MCGTKDLFTSTPRQTNYQGLIEYAAAGLHQKAFELFGKHVPSGGKVLDLGSGGGAWAKRLFDAPYTVTACDLHPKGPFEFPFCKVDLNQDFSEKFEKEGFDAVSMVEVIEHLENPRHTFRQILSLLKSRGVILITTPNASGLYSRLRFFFTGEMAMFSDAAYHGVGHITPLTCWHLDKLIKENDLEILERQFHDSPFFPPKSIGDVAKIIAWCVFRPLMFGTVGGQCVLFILRKRK